jgi:uncharacterized protein
MDRRSFLKKSAFYLSTTFFGLNMAPIAMAKANAPVGSYPFPRIAIIIDDIGHSLSRAKNFLKLNVPITYSILPKLTYSSDLSEKIRDQGHEIMLHQPMEPFNPRIDPGPGALYVGDDRGKIVDTLEGNIEEMPFAVGVNNHMGSKFTSTRREIADALNVIKKKELFFIDSLTSWRSNAFQTAKKLRMATAHRHIFLDNVVQEHAIYCQLLKLVRHATRYGLAVGIGHPFPETAAAIEKYLGALSHSRVSLVYASQIL